MMLSKWNDVFVGHTIYRRSQKPHGVTDERLDVLMHGCWHGTVGIEGTDWGLSWYNGLNWLVVHDKLVVYTRDIVELWRLWKEFGGCPTCDVSSTGDTQIGKHSKFDVLPKQKHGNCAWEFERLNLLIRSRAILDTTIVSLDGSWSCPGHASGSRINHSLTVIETTKVS